MANSDSEESKEQEAKQEDESPRPPRLMRPDAFGGIRSQVERENKKQRKDVLGHLATHNEEKAIESKTVLPLDPAITHGNCLTCRRVGPVGHLCKQCETELVRFVTRKTPLQISPWLIAATKGHLNHSQALCPIWKKSKDYVEHKNYYYVAGVFEVKDIMLFHGKEDNEWCTGSGVEHVICELWHSCKWQANHCIGALSAHLANKKMHNEFDREEIEKQIKLLAEAASSETHHFGR